MDKYQSKKQMNSSCNNNTNLEISEFMRLKNEDFRE